VTASRETERWLWAWGVSLALLEGLILAGLMATNAMTGLKVLSMIGACHLGGRLALIGAGLEHGFSVLSIVAIGSLHNGVVLLWVYALWLRLSKRLETVPLIARLSEKARLSRSLRPRWSLMGIAIFIWLPLPMTGAVVGAILAHIEGYAPRQVVTVAFGSMVAGVITWTMAFEPLYNWMRELGPHITTAATLVLVLLLFLLNVMPRRNSMGRVS
jgi:uncharacterized membrane protein